jgi:oligopeptide/dipeptide ABC transporter ATP-binding protein
LGVVAHHADRVLVMYAGEPAESAGTASLFSSPQHPYTQALLGALPDPSRIGKPLASIPGMVPTPAQFPAGCRFSTRCERRLERCANLRPGMTETAVNHAVHCWLHEHSP